MSFFKRFKGTVIAVSIYAIVLAISFFYPGQENISTGNQPEEVLAQNVFEQVGDVVENEIQQTTVPSPTPSLPPPAKMPEPEVTEENSALFCTLAVRCDTLLNNLEKVAPEKIPLIPENGAILSETKLEFSEGETVFDVLQRELKSRKIHFEFVSSPMYDSVYIEGIGNLYEFDAGNLSGWIYRVNGKAASVGCSQYKLKNGDKIEFLYTCNLGRDL